MLGIDGVRGGCHHSACSTILGLVDAVRVGRAARSVGRLAQERRRRRLVVKQGRMQTTGFC